MDGTQCCEITRTILHTIASIAVWSSQCLFGLSVLYFPTSATTHYVARFISTARLIRGSTMSNALNRCRHRQHRNKCLVVKVGSTLWSIISHNAVQPAPPAITTAAEDANTTTVATAQEPTPQTANNAPANAYVSQVSKSLLLTLAAQALQRRERPQQTRLRRIHSVEASDYCPYTVDKIALTTKHRKSFVFGLFLAFMRLRQCISSAPSLPSPRRQPEDTMTKFPSAPQTARSTKSAKSIKSSRSVKSAKRSASAKVPAQPAI